MNTQNNNLMQRTTLIRLSTVMRMTGYSKSWIYQAIKTGNFPKPIKLGPRTTVFIEYEVELWVAEKVITSRSSASKEAS